MRTNTIVGASQSGLQLEVSLKKKIFSGRPSRNVNRPYYFRCNNFLNSAKLRVLITSFFSNQARRA